MKSVDHIPADRLPSRIGSIPDLVVLRAVDEDVLRGKAHPRAAPLDKATTMVGGPDDRRWDVEPVRDLIEEAGRRFEASPTQADAWLAPRLHATMRMTRREAADSGLWNTIAARVAPDYVAWRWLPTPTVRTPEPTIAMRRFCGPFHVQAFARLWWVAEIFRDSDDYGPVVTACQNQETFNTLLRNEVYRHRPTAQAAVRISAEVARQTRELNALDKAINAAGSTLVYEMIGPDNPPDADAVVAWIQESRSAAPAPYDRLPSGPDDGQVDRTAIALLADVFTKLYTEAPVRGREEVQEGQQSIPDQAADSPAYSEPAIARANPTGTAFPI